MQCRAAWRARAGPRAADVWGHGRLVSEPSKLTSPPTRPLQLAPLAITPFRSTQFSLLLLACDRVPLATEAGSTPQICRTAEHQQLMDALQHFETEFERHAQSFGARLDEFGQSLDGLQHSMLNTEEELSARLAALAAAESAHAASLARLSCAPALQGSGRGAAKSTGEQACRGGRAHCDGQSWVVLHSLCLWHCSHEAAESQTRV